MFLPLKSHVFSFLPFWIVFHDYTHNLYIWLKFFPKQSSTSHLKLLFQMLLSVFWSGFVFKHCFFYIFLEILKDLSKLLILLLLLADKCTVVMKKLKIFFIQLSLKIGLSASSLYLCYKIISSKYLHAYQHFCICKMWVYIYRI